jgi:hypothetical protein
MPEMSEANGQWRQAEATPEGQFERTKRSPEEKALAAHFYKLLWDLSKGRRRNSQFGNIRAWRAHSDSGVFQRIDRESNRSPFLTRELLDRTATNRREA